MLDSVVRNFRTTATNCKKYSIDFVILITYNKDVDRRLKFSLKEKGRRQPSLFAIENDKRLKFRLPNDYFLLRPSSM